MASALHDFVHTTALHGPAEIYYAKSSAGRLYWSVVFAAMVTSGTYFTYTVLVSYMEAPITTLVSTVDATSGMPLPEVAICYTGAIDVTKLLENGLSKQAVRAVQKQFLYGEHWRTVERATWSEAIDSFKAAKPEILDFIANRNITDYGDLIKYASFNCSQLIHKCHQLEQSEPSNNFSCMSLKTVPNAIYGTCYILPTRTQYLPSVSGGWTILLKAPLEHDLVQDLLYTRSFALQVAEKYDRTTIDSFKLPLNRTVAISLQPTKYNRLEYRQWPRSNVARCYQITRNQSFINCQRYCLTFHMLQQCQCFVFYIPRANFGTKYKNHSICWPDDEYRCDAAVAANEPEYRTCLENCLALCDETVYGVVVSYADFDAEQTITELGLAGNTQGVIQVQIGYNAMRYTSMEEKDTFGLDGCISNIGGMLGLWLGGSIFTIIHLLTTLCGCCRHKTQTRPTPGADRGVRTTQRVGLNASYINQQLQSNTRKIDLNAGFEMSALQ